MIGEAAAVCYKPQQRMNASRSTPASQILTGPAGASLDGYFSFSYAWRFS